MIFYPTLKGEIIEGLAFLTPFMARRRTKKLNLLTLATPAGRYSVLLSFNFIYNIKFLNATHQTEQYQIMLYQLFH